MSTTSDQDWFETINVCFWKVMFINKSWGWRRLVCTTKKRKLETKWSINVAEPLMHLVGWVISWRKHEAKRLLTYLATFGLVSYLSRSRFMSSSIWTSAFVSGRSVSILLKISWNLSNCCFAVKKVDCLLLGLYTNPTMIFFYPIKIFTNRVS